MGMFGFGNNNVPVNVQSAAPERRTNPLISILESVAPGDEPSYELCKLIYTKHPIGAKIIEAPLQLVFSQSRAISGIPEAVKTQFETVWKNVSADAVIRNTVRISKMDGVATLAELSPGVFNVYDALNTAGSFGANLEPLSPQFMKTPSVRVQDRVFGPGECIVLHNGPPVYLDYVESGYGYTGRSCYHAALFDLGTYLDVMHANRLISQKSGVLVAKIKQMGAAVTGAMQQLSGFKRNLLKEARTYNVVQVGHEDEVESLNLMHAVEANNGSKESILDSIAAAVGMPAIILKSETLAQGLGGSGAEDSKVIANYVSEERQSIQALYDFMIPRVQKIAWTQDFYAAFQEAETDYANVPYETALYEWIEEFVSEWPDFLREQKSEKAKAAETTMKMVIDGYNTFQAALSPDDRRMFCQTFMETWNSDGMKEFLPVSLDLNLDGDFADPAPTEIKESVSESPDGDASSKDE